MIYRTFEVSAIVLGVFKAYYMPRERSGAYIHTFISALIHPPEVTGSNPGPLRGKLVSTFESKLVVFFRAFNNV